ncbi:uncharacterized protein LOC108597561 [Drosophila busckii]|nr:uncharacterized protein LOC108597561 [Drosophila busckii]
MLLLLPLLGLGLAKKQKPLDSWQKHYYQSLWPMKVRFTTTPRPGRTPEPLEMRKVFPCFCYTPKIESEADKATTKSYEKFIQEPKEIFIVN